jgi:hypothetical protein
VSDIVLQEGQKLREEWTVEYVGRSRMHRPADDWVECRIVHMYHSTIYGGANGTGKTVEEARLNGVLGLARAICNDGEAFKHDSYEIFRQQQLGWFEDKLQEYRESLELGEDVIGSEKKLKRRIKLLEQLTAEWQEDHDYWPKETK